MEFQVSDAVKNMILNEMISNNLHEIEEFGMFFSIEKVEGALPTGQFLKTGEEIYIHP